MALHASVKISNLKEKWFCYDAAKFIPREVFSFFMRDDTSILCAADMSVERTLSTL